MSVRCSVAWLDDVCEQLVSVEASAQSVSNELRARESEWQSAASAAAQLRSSMETQLQSLTMTLASKEAELSSAVSARASLQTELDVRVALVVVW